METKLFSPFMLANEEAVTFSTARGALTLSKVIKRSLNVLSEPQWKPEHYTCSSVVDLALTAETLRSVETRLQTLSSQSAHLTREGSQTCLLFFSKTK